MDKLYANGVASSNMGFGIHLIEFENNTSDFSKQLNNSS